ncbi:MAG: hypothetical protein R2747_11890 [Pyrinomonadaceae bacterium]
MNSIKKTSLLSIFFLAAILIFGQSASAQEKTGFEVLSGKDQIKAVVPTSFYFAGLSAGTQMRNSAAAKLGEKRYLVAGLVDVSGYSTEIQGFYEGFFITDSPVNFGDQTLDVGAYGFGFSKDGKVNLYDLGGNKIKSASTSSDKGLKRPTPLMMATEENGIRFYRGRDYVVISPR